MTCPPDQPGAPDPSVRKQTDRHDESNNMNHRLARFFLRPATSPSISGNDATLGLFSPFNPAANRAIAATSAQLQPPSRHDGHPTFGHGPSVEQGSFLDNCSTSLTRDRVHG